MRPKLAVNVMRVQFPLEVIDEINSHIDDTIIPNNVDYSLPVGQYVREKSTNFISHEGDEVGEQFSCLLMRLGSEQLTEQLVYLVMLICNQCGRSQLRG